MIKGRFYGKEMVRIKMGEGNLYQIEKILRRRKMRNGTEQVYVKWKGWHKSHNQWVAASELVDI